MSGSLINKATSVVQQLSGQSRYRVDVHECTDFLDVAALQRGGIPQSALAV
jgi:type VI secretion system secreted protein VgrG